MRKIDGVRVDHEKKRHGVRVPHEKKSDGRELTIGKRRWGAGSS